MESILWSFCWHSALHMRYYVLNEGWWFWEYGSVQSAAELSLHFVKILHWLVDWWVVEGVHNPVL